MSNTRITYTPRSDATLEREVSALASVYAYLLKDRDSEKADKPAPDTHPRRPTGSRAAV